MLIVEPDFDRRIDLPNVGPCQRPIDIDRTKAPLSKLVSLRVYSFDRDVVIDGEAEGDEVFIVLMRGQAGIRTSGSDAAPQDFALGSDGGTRAIYLPPHHAYQLSTRADCDVAYARVAAEHGPYRPARGFAPVEDRLAVVDYAAGMTMDLIRHRAGDALAQTAHDGRESERFLHLRAASDGVATLDGHAFGDWHAAVLADGEHARLTVDRGSVDVLMISAATDDNAYIPQTILNAARAAGVATIGQPQQLRPAAPR